MNNIFKGHSLKAANVNGQLTRSEFNGLNIWFSYAEPIAISSDNGYVILNDTSYSSTTSRHISAVRRMFVSVREMNNEEFEERLERILDKTSNKSWNSYD